MEFIIEALIAILIVAAGFFGIVGSYGLAKLPDLMTRLHGPTKATTLGIGGVLIASMLLFALRGQGLSTHELLITLFLFLTAPISANFIAKSFLHRRLARREALPEPQSGMSWATFEAPPSSNGDEPDSVVATRRPAPSKAKAKAKTKAKSARKAAAKKAPARDPKSGPPE